MTVIGKRRLGPLAAATSLAAVTLFAANIASAALCVWLNPDRDMKNFFPGGDGYATDVRKYDDAQKQSIEKRIGITLDPDENEFKFYRVKKRGQVLGTVLTHQARGRYGAVQTIVGIGPDGKVIGVYVQRHREPVNLNQDAFLAQFKGKTAADPFEVGRDVAAVAAGQEQSSAAVAFSVRKILVVHEILGSGR